MSRRINLTELKKRIAIDKAYTPAEREFLLDAINDVTQPCPIGKPLRLRQFMFDDATELGWLKAESWHFGPSVKR
jgi:hypothetical protein